MWKWLNNGVRDSNSIILSHFFKGSGGRVVKVCASQPRDRGFETYIVSRPWFLIGHQYWLVPGSGLESDLSKLWELVSQSS